MQVSSMVCYDEKNYKYLIGYKDDDHKIKLLSIMLLKTSNYVKSYDGETTWLNFFIKDDDLLKEYNNICKKVSNSILREHDWEHIYNTKFLKTKIRSQGDEATIFNCIKTTEAGPDYICWSVIIIYSVLRKD